MNILIFFFGFNLIKQYKNPTKFNHRPFSRNYEEDYIVYKPTNSTNKGQNNNDNNKK